MPVFQVVRFICINLIETLRKLYVSYTFAWIMPKDFQTSERFLSTAEERCDFSGMSDNGVVAGK